MEVTIVELEGTYNRSAGGPRADYAVAVAIVPGPRSDLFFKFVAPRATLDKWRDGFLAMVDGLRTAP
jgi:hypothetical protein